MAVYRFKVVNVSDKGALLITDGNKLAWVMQRQQRKDGTFGDGSKRALEKSIIQGSSVEDYDNHFSKKVSCIVYSESSPLQSDKAFNIKGEWFPKSQCSISELSPVEGDQNRAFSVTGPRWLLHKKLPDIVTVF